VRRRVPDATPLTQVWFLNNSGDNWFQFATVNFKFAGEVRTVGPVAWLPVFIGGVNNEIGLVPMATATPPGLPPPTYDDSDVVRLPAGGSLGQRFTEFDKHAIYAVHPTNWGYVIAPDVVGNNVKVTRDGALPREALEPDDLGSQDAAGGPTGERRRKAAGHIQQ
jgi:hypothetical protein